MNKRLFLLALLLGWASAGICETQTYTVLRRLSMLNFEVSAQIHTVHGVSQFFSGTIKGDPSDITTASLAISLDPASFNTDNDKRDREMREKCLETDRFPRIEFASTSISADKKVLKEGEPLNASVTGKLKLHGLEKEVTVPVKILLKGDNLTAEGSMHISLDDWSIFRPKVILVQLQNDVTVTFTIGARRVP